MILLGLFAAGLLAGALNAVAGGGSFIALPALLSAGIPPVSANASTTVALWPASLSSAVAYRHEIATRAPWLRALGGISLIGGALGGMLLLQTSDERFTRILPWLMLIAAATFTFGARIVRMARSAAIAAIPAVVSSSAASRQAVPGAGTRPSARQAGRPPLWTLALQLGVATYGGYFGGGIGIMMLAILSVTGMTNVHEMNGLKAILAVIINGIAVVEFVAFGAVAWLPAVVMMAGGILGGYGAAFLARQLPPRLVRIFILVVAWTMTAYFFLE